MRFVLPRLKSYRAKLTVVLILIVVILGGSSGGYYLYKNKSSADTINPAGAIHSKLTGTDLVASGCNNNLNTADCLQVAPTIFSSGQFNTINTIDLIQKNYISQYQDVVQQCVKSDSTVQWFNTNVIGSTTTVSVTTPYVYNCDIKILKKDKDTYHYEDDPPSAKIERYRAQLQIGINLKTTGADYENIDFAKTTTKGSVGNVIGSFSGTSVLGVNFSTISENNIFTYSGQIGDIFGLVPKLSGTVEIPYKMNLDSDQDLKNSFSSLEKDGIKVNHTLSKWNIIISGQTYGTIKYSNDGSGNLKIVNYTFCDKGCTFSTAEKMYLVGNQAATSTNNFQGGIVSYAYHKEIYSGTISTLKDASGNFTGALKWNSDVKIQKTDTRNWKHKFVGSTNTNNFYNYTGNTDSTAELRPFDSAFGPDGYSRINTKIVKTFQSKIKMYPMRDFYTTEDISINKFENTLNGVFTRTGTGVRTSGNSLQAAADKSYQRGIYDNNSDGKMLVTETKGFTLGSRIDPIGYYINPFYTKSYAPDARAAGFFTAGYYNKDATKTIFSTPTAKAVPKDIAVLFSFNYDANVFPPGDIIKIKKFFADLSTEFGTKVTYYDSNSKDKFFNTLSAVPKDAWVVNFGHGSPTGLSAGTDFIVWSDINNYLATQDIQFSVFAADSCFSAHGSSIAQIVIGSLSFGLGGGVVASPGSINNIGPGSGSNRLNFTLDQLLLTIRNLIPARADPTM